MILRLRADAGRLPLDDGSVHCAVTSPPYFRLRRYAGVPETIWGGDLAHAHVWGAPQRPVCACGAWRGCLGNEPSVDLYVAHLVAVFREVRRALRDDGVCWVVLGDSFSGGGSFARSGLRQHAAFDRTRPSREEGVPPGNLMLVPWRFALAAQQDGWVVRNDLAWCKRSPMPESVHGWAWQRCRVKTAPCSASHAGGVRDCEGCDKCAANEGFVLRHGSWRHTRAHEVVIMLAKSMGYFANAAAAAEPAVSDHGSGNGAQWPERRRACRPHHKRPQRASFADADGPRGSGATWEPAPGATRNPRSWLLLRPEPLDAPHYAAFPTALVEPLIRACTSARGVCPRCGAPWAAAPQPPSGSSPGWRATCGCNAGEPVPATVLDPFAGSGTTLRVALQLGRRAVGCDLSRTYLRDIADARTRVQLPLSGEMA